MTIRDGNGKTNWSVVMIVVLQVVVTILMGFLYDSIKTNAAAISTISKNQIVVMKSLEGFNGSVQSERLLQVQRFIADHDGKAERASAKCGRLHHNNSLPKCGSCHERDR